MKGRYYEIRFLRTVDDTTGDFKRAYKRCKDAEKQLNAGFPNQCIEFYNQALMIVIKCIYKREELSAPTVHHPEKGSEPVNADYMHRDSPFASWLDNDFVLKLCHDIRLSRNKCSLSYNEEIIIEQSDVYFLVNKLETILRFILNKTTKTEFNSATMMEDLCDDNNDNQDNVETEVSEYSSGRCLGIKIERI